MSLVISKLLNFKKQSVILNRQGPKVLSDATVEQITTNPELKKLSLQSNQLVLIPEALFKSPPALYTRNLKELVLDNNSLEEIPSAIKELVALEKLYVQFNKLTSICDEVYTLIRLKTLALAGNRIEDISAEIQQLRNLKKLYLQTNRISVLPPELCYLTNLRELLVYENQLTNVPYECVMEGCRSILSTLKKQGQFSSSLYTISSSSESTYSLLSDMSDAPERKSTKLSKEKIMKQLRDMLRDPIGREAFRSHLQAEHNEENLLFYEAVSKFNYSASLITDNQYVYQEAVAIYDKFLKEGQYSINLPSAVQTQLVQTMTAAKDNPTLITKNVFEHAKVSVLNTMAKDPFVRFLKSPYYKEFLEKRPNDIWHKRNKALGLL